jgi:hypothetical protein
MARTKVSSGMILLVILGLVVLADLLSPSESDIGGPGSTYSAGQSGMRLAFDLSRRLGWSSDRREVPFTADTVPAPVQILIGVRPGAEEAHALLDHVRRGGGLLVAGTEGVFGDSLYVTSGSRGFSAPDVAGECPAPDPFEDVLRGGQLITPVRWRRPPPRDTVGFGHLNRRDERPAVGFPLGAGRVVVVADEEYLTNDVMRRCTAEADVAYVRMLEYLTSERRSTRIAFDEFHHGQGIHGGSLTAIRDYVVTTPSGRLLGQIAVAGLLLLIAAAPRPLAPRESTRVARRSPLEHADALAHAYAAVGATRTATARLLGGLRRRTRRTRAGARERDDQILAAVTAVSPTAAPAASLVARALTDPLPARDLPAIASALSTIETALTAGPSTRKS